MKTVLGMTMRDTITGFSGVVTGRAEYISGCAQALLVPKVKDDGALPESHWFDEQRLELLLADQVVLKNGDTPGCDREAPKR